MEGNDNKVLRTVPVVAIRGSVVFPHTDSILSFGRQKSVAAVNAAFSEDRVVAIFTQKDTRVTSPDFSDLYNIGTIATITQMMSTDGEIHAMVRGHARIKLVEGIAREPYLVAKIEELSEAGGDSDKVKAQVKNLVELFKKSVNLGKPVEITTVMRMVSGQVEAGELVDSVASVLDVKTSERQKILENQNVESRLEKVTELLSQEVNVLDIERTISVKTQKRFEDQMRKAMLREKKRTIEQELGEDEFAGMSDGEIGEYKLKIKEAGMPKEIKVRAKKELKRLSQLSPNNPEGGYIRNYLDWLCDMPWSKVSPNDVKIKDAEKILDNDHYGLDKAKERIVEYLAVMKLKSAFAKASARQGVKDESVEHPTILCFVGPPGVGKTSIGKSIAKALGRKFVRVSLGGIRDEAEIRGHRRTYVGALPGRIIQGIKDAGTKNPVFMLDEIDKVGVDFRGDPSSALLEALDPEQNKEFSDHYLEVPFDLSQVMFICTANITDTIPSPLLDRMELIKFPGYIDEEKYNIASKYLWEKQLKVHGISDKKIKISRKVMMEIIGKYTREAGVRDLERNLATVCRKVAKLLAEGKKYPKNITTKNLSEFLGPRKFSSQIAGKSDEVGMVTGLSVTPAGGEILFIEVTLMPGRGKLTLTGQLGQVMKESAKAAHTWTKSNYRMLGLREDFAGNLDVHIHVPEGAVKKDGPSAGVAMTTALVSALTGIKVKRDVGMTGEVTLRGRVLEIGGIKEKVIAGHRAGLTTIVLPKDNKKDLVDIPENVKKKIKFVFAEEVEDVLSTAMIEWPPVARVGVKNLGRPSFIAAA